MNKIEKLHESIRTLFRSEGEKFCYTPGEIERLVCSLNYKQLYSVLCDMAEPVFACCAGGGICDSHQYHSTKLFPAHATLIWSDEGEPLGDDNISTSYSNELWLLEDMTIAAVSCFRVLNSAASYITEYREYKGDEWPAHLVPVNITEPDSSRDSTSVSLVSTPNRSVPRFIFSPREKPSMPSSKPG